MKVMVNERSGLYEIFWDFLAQVTGGVMRQTKQDEQNADHTCDFRLEAVFLRK